jgi:hypothetical protein
MMDFEFIEGTEKRTRKGIKGQIRIKGNDGKVRKQWIIAPYPEGDSYRQRLRRSSRGLPRSSFETSTYWYGLSESASKNQFD